MRKRLLVCLTAVLCTLGLSGCIFGDVDEMYALPKSSEAYVNLQARINQEKGNAESIAPLSGENRQAIQLVDVDRDGEQEAISFFRDTSSDTPLTIVIFKQDEHGDYQVLAKIQGVGSDIEFISYPNLGGAGGDILVSWQVNAATHTLAAYTITGDQPTEIFKANSGRCLTADLDGDDQEEIILAPATTGETPLRLDYYDNQDGRMELVSTSPLSQGAIEIDTWSSDQLSDGTPALFVTSFCKKRRPHYRCLLPQPGPRPEKHRPGPGDPPEQRRLPLRRRGRTHRHQRRRRPRGPRLRGRPLLWGQFPGHVLVAALGGLCA